MNLRSFTLGDIQNFFALCSVFESEGVTDLRFVRERLQNHINAEHAEMKKQLSGKTKNNKPTDQPMPCPSCQNGILRPVANSEGLQIIGCNKCRYSRVI